MSTPEDKTDADAVEETTTEVADSETDSTVADTIATPEVEVPLKAQPIDPPTLAMSFSVNDSPLAGRDGDKVTSRMIRDRLMRESEGNVAIHVTETVEVEDLGKEGHILHGTRDRVLQKSVPGRCLAVPKKVGLRHPDLEPALAIGLC